MFSVKYFLYCFVIDFLFLKQDKTVKHTCWLFNLFNGEKKLAKIHGEKNVKKRV